MFLSELNSVPFSVLKVARITVKHPTGERIQNMRHKVLAGQQRGVFIVHNRTHMKNVCQYAHLKLHIVIVDKPVIPRFISHWHVQGLEFAKQSGDCFLACRKQSSPNDCSM